MKKLSWKFRNDYQERINKLNYSERQLAARLIISAIHDLLGQAVLIKSEDRGNARVWLQRGDYGAVTFNWCCDILGLDPETIREKIKQGTVSPLFLKEN